MEIRVLKTFVAVAQLKGFSAAARALNTVQPAISRQIADLESELGVALFWRSTRDVRITAAGETLLREAIDILALEARARDLVRRVGHGQSGRLRIGFISSAAQAFLPRLIRSFRAQFPDVAVSLSEMTAQEQIEALNAGQLDVSLSRPITRPLANLPDIDSVALYTDRLMAFMPSGHALAQAQSIALDALAAEPFVFFERGGAPDLFDHIISTCRSAGFSPTIAAQPNSMQAVLTGVGSGLGVSLAPGCIRALNMTGCVCRPLAVDAGPIPFELHTRADHPEPPTVAFKALVMAARDDIRAQMAL
ncbi:LysR family transcriptional regulator [Albirhodobacter sp. R86504]|jgi:DNA-binding transcriptional LysR family regulator|uniref:LysR family transcriptional regulator n=1 Tax=Albirhodobacter sp. R86504 TaxID=3093848 RepID=UPI00366BECC3